MVRMLRLLCRPVCIHAWLMAANRGRRKVAHCVRCAVVTARLPLACTHPPGTLPPPLCSPHVWRVAALPLQGAGAGVPHRHGGVPRPQVRGVLSQPRKVACLPCMHAHSVTVARTVSCPSHVQRGGGGGGGQGSHPHAQGAGLPFVCVARFPSLWALGFQRREQKP